MNVENQYDGRPPNWRRNLVLTVGFYLILVACLCLGFYVLLIELNLSHVRSVLLAVSIFAVYSLLLLWASVTAIRNPPTDPYAAPRFSPELCAWLTTAASQCLGGPLDSRWL